VWTTPEARDSILMGHVSHLWGKTQDLAPPRAGLFLCLERSFAITVDDRSDCGLALQLTAPLDNRRGFFFCSLISAAASSRGAPGPCLPPPDTGAGQGAADLGRETFRQRSDVTRQVTGASPRAFQVPRLAPPDDGGALFLAGQG
jgi:hypothetical protein